MNILLKQSYSRTEVALAKPFSIPDEIRASATKLPGEQEMTLEMALGSPVRTLTSVKGKVVQVSPSTKKTVKEAQTAFQEVKLKDKTGTACLALWDKMVDTVQTGQLLKVSKCRVRLYNEEKKLTTTAGSQMEIINSDADLLQVSDEEEEEETSVDADGKEFQITAVFDCDPYLSCPSKGCNNTKLITIYDETRDKYLMSCKNCKGMFTASASNSYLRATVLLETTEGTESVKVAIFLPEINKIFASRGRQFVMGFEKDLLMRQLFDIIPIQGNFKVVINTIRAVALKRDVPP